MLIVKTTDLLKRILKDIPGVPKKNPIRFFRKGRGIFFKNAFNSKSQPISTSFKKEISILRRIAKKLQACQFLQNYLSEKASGSKN